MNEYIKSCRPGVCDAIQYLEWVSHCPDSLWRFTSQSWSCKIQGRNGAGKIPELGWGPAAAVAGPSARGVTRPIMKQRWLLNWNSPVWRRRARLGQGNAGLKFCFGHSVKDILFLNNNAKIWISATCHGNAQLIYQWKWRATPPTTDKNVMVCYKNKAFSFLSILLMQEALHLSHFRCLSVR